MKTTKVERETAQRLGNWMSDEFVFHLIADVDDAVKRLRQQHEALAPNKKLPHSLCGVCDFLKEPNDAD